MNELNILPGQSSVCIYVCIRINIREAGKQKIIKHNGMGLFLNMYTQDLLMIQFPGYFGNVHTTQLLNCKLHSVDSGLLQHPSVKCLLSPTKTYRATHELTISNHQDSFLLPCFYSHLTFVM